MTKSEARRVYGDVRDQLRSRRWYRGGGRRRLLPRLRDRTGPPVSPRDVPSRDAVSRHLADQRRALLEGVAEAVHKLRTMTEADLLAELVRRYGRPEVAAALAVRGVALP